MWSFRSRKHRHRKPRSNLRHVLSAARQAAICHVRDGIYRLDVLPVAGYPVIITVIGEEVRIEKNDFYYQSGTPGR